MQAAIQYLSSQQPPQTEDERDTLFELADPIGPFHQGLQTIYREEFRIEDFIPNFEPSPKARNKLTAKAGTGVLSSLRDVQLEFTGVADTSLPLLEGFELYINDSFVERITNFNFTNEIQKSLVVNRKFFVIGDNTIELRPTSNNTNWGIRELSLKFLPSIAIRLGQIDTNEYGYESDLPPNLNPIFG